MSDCYVATAPCGHLRAWISFERPRRELERFAADCLRRGLRIEAAVTDEVRHTIGDDCELCSTKEASATQGSLFEVAP